MKSICSYQLQDYTNLKSDNLIVEIGDYGMSFMIFDFESNKLKLLNMFEFEKQDDLLRNLQMQDTWLSSKIDSDCKVFVFYNFRESILVPEKFHNKENSGSLLDLMFGQSEDYILIQEHVSSKSIYNIYRVPEQIHHWFMLHFPKCAFKHSSSNQTEEIKEGTVIRCIVSFGSLKVIFSNQGQLQLIQHFPYSSPEDALYFLLRVCETHGVKPTDVKIQLNGLLTSDSALFDLIYNYFTDIGFYSSSFSDIEMDNGIELPAHYFSHLLDLAS